jgi:hypothetical protein
MGQVYLGFRSLLVKIAVFVAMASMLAWILGGTLWPRVAMRPIGEPVFDGRVVLVDQIGGDRSSYGLAIIDSDGEIGSVAPSVTNPGSKVWLEALAPVSDPRGQAAAVAFRRDSGWVVLRFEKIMAAHGVGRSPASWPPGNDDLALYLEVDSRLDAARILDEFRRGQWIESSSSTDQSTDTEADATGDASSDG